MLRPVRTIVVWLIVMAAALGGCAAPGAQYSAEESCKSSGGVWRAGFCEKPVQGY